jgi:hypothetical protein
LRPYKVGKKEAVVGPLPGVKTEIVGESKENAFSVVPTTAAIVILTPTIFPCPFSLWQRMLESETQMLELH